MRGLVGLVLQMPQSGSVPQVGADAESGERAARQWRARLRADGWCRARWQRRKRGRVSTHLENVCGAARGGNPSLHIPLARKYELPNEDLREEVAISGYERDDEVRRRADEMGAGTVGGLPRALPLWIGQGQLKNTVAPVRRGRLRLVETDVKVVAWVCNRRGFAASRVS